MCGASRNGKLNFLVAAQRFSSLGDQRRFWHARSSYVVAAAAFAGVSRTVSFLRNSSRPWSLSSSSSIAASSRSTTRLYCRERCRRCTPHRRRGARRNGRRPTGPAACSLRVGRARSSIWSALVPATPVDCGELESPRRSSLRPVVVRQAFSRPSDRERAAARSILLFGYRCSSQPRSLPRPVVGFRCFAPVPFLALAYQCYSAPAAVRPSSRRSFVVRPFVRSTNKRSRLWTLDVLLGSSLKQHHRCTDPPLSVAALYLPDYAAATNHGSVYFPGRCRRQRQL